MSSVLNEVQTAKLSLWFQVNTSLSAYSKLIKAFFNAQNAVAASTNDWKQLGLHAKHVARHGNVDATQEFLSQINSDISIGKYKIVFQDEESYPAQLYELFDPPPLLFVRGNINRLHEAQIAVVGSRKPTPHAQKITFDMSQYLAEAGYIITSGLAQGVDFHAHMGALTQNDELSFGRTVGVMGTGIDVCYPRSHGNLFTQIIAAGGCLVSELLPKAPANKYTFPRRNRIVAGLSLGTIVTEAKIQSGSLITARLTSEQGKQVFAIPSHIDNKNAEGCHHLIREGATLIYHPEQVLEDIKYQQIQPRLNLKSVDSNITKKATENLNRTTVIENMLEEPKVSTEINIENQSIDLSTKNVSNISKNNTVIYQVSSTKKSNIKPSKTLQQNPTQTVLPLANTELSSSLNKLFAQIDWKGVDLDRLVAILQLDAQTLLVQLMELELLGLIRQEGGRYVRV